MARVTLPRAVALELFGGQVAVEVSGATLFAVIHALEALGPGFEELAGNKLAIAVDGVLADDWSIPVGPAADILVVMRVAGG